MAATGLRVFHSVRIALRASTGQAYIRRPDSSITLPSDLLLLKYLKLRVL